MDKQYLDSGTYTNSNHPAVIAYTKKKIKGIQSLHDQVLALYYAVRDDFKYYPYHLILKPDYLKASYLLTKDYGYCVEKSNLFAACMRVIGVPSRLSFANVRNHLATEKVESYLQTDLMVFHGFVEIFLHEKWVKATPVFNKELCEKLGVAPLEFNGYEDSIFQESDKNGKPFMSYEHEYGYFVDVPFELFLSELKSNYPHIFEKKINDGKIIVDF